MAVRFFYRVFGSVLAYGLPAFLWMSCTEEITVNLRSGDPEIVIEARLPESGFAEVRISETVGFNKPNDFPVVTGAQVIIQNSEGQEEILTETSPGIYKSFFIKGIPEEQYGIYIESAGKTYYSEDIMPDPVRILYLRVRNSDFPVGPVGRDFFPTQEVIVGFVDPANEKNYYRFVEYKNDEFENFYLETDLYTDGDTIKKFLFDPERSLSAGDVLTVEMQVISKQVYDYFRTFPFTGGGTFTGSPANPLTNIEGANLGFFSAYTVHRKSVVIEED